VTSPTQKPSCSISISPVLLDCGKYLLHSECAVCKSRTYATIAPAKDGIGLSLSSSHYHLASLWRFKPYVVLTFGERILISCVYCGHGFCLLVNTGSADGTSFTLESLDREPRERRSKPRFSDIIRCADQVTKVHVPKKACNPPACDLPWNGRRLL
jgi:hypothetical protein